MQLRTTVAAVLLAASTTVFAQPAQPLLDQVRANKQPFLDTLKELVSIESGSDDREGLDRISQLIYDKLKALGGTVEFIEPGNDVYRMDW